MLRDNSERVDDACSPLEDRFQEIADKEDIVSWLHHTCTCDVLNVLSLLSIGKLEYFVK